MCVCVCVCVGGGGACVLGLNHMLMCYFSEPQKGYNYLNVEGVQKRQNVTGQVAQWRQKPLYIDTVLLFEQYIIRSQKTELYITGRTHFLSKVLHIHTIIFCRWMHIVCIRTHTHVRARAHTHTHTHTHTY